MSTAANADLPDAAPARSGVVTRAVTDEEAGLRLDRWFRRHYPALSHGRLEKLLRTGQVRVDGHRAKAGQRLVAGQGVRVPPLDAERTPRRPSRAAVPLSEPEAEALRAAVLYRDDDVIALDKPPGLAVQGGSGTHRHLDGMLDALRFGAAERPRLVHRLDKDTSGVLLLGRSAAAAARLAAAFRAKETRKLYWALVVGAPRPADGRVDLALAKGSGRGGEQMVHDAEAGKRAVTLYRTLETAGREVSWLALMPLSGRTHQLRVHMAALGTPILGDGKYGRGTALLQARGLSRKLHLHARAIALPVEGKRWLRVEAPLPPHMAASWRFFGFDAERSDDPFAED